MATLQPRSRISATVSSAVYQTQIDDFGPGRYASIVAHSRNSVALSLSPEAGRELDDLVDHDPARLPPIPVIRGSATAIGVHFHHPRVRDFLAGAR